MKMLVTVPKNGRDKMVSRAAPEHALLEHIPVNP
jgi:hypothetical protein